MFDRKRFLPATRDEMNARGWAELDVLLITGDAYFDHPSHGAAQIGRLLEKNGYRVGIVFQPDWRSTGDFTELGAPTLWVGVTAGAVDSVVNNYTAGGAVRRSDVYSPGGRSGHRPDNATLVYAARAKEAFPRVPMVLGGVEASIRRFAYVEARKSKLRRSILIDSRADLLVYGSGEYQALEISRRLERNGNLEGIMGTARILPHKTPVPEDAVELPSFEAVQDDSSMFLRQSLSVEESGAPYFAKQMFQSYEEGVVLAEPPPAVSKETFDSYFDLSFVGECHPTIGDPVPALETVRWSVISHRGCPGGCSFCALAVHQGRRVQSRSESSVLGEISKVVKRDRFKGTISDIGGPTANAYDALTLSKPACLKCRRPSCLFPRICPHIHTGHDKLLGILERVSAAEGVKRVFLASGIRHDLALADPIFIKELARHYTGGHLKAAPEHVSPEVLRLMRKPGIELFEAFERLFKKESAAAQKKQYIVPYIIAAFPGCSEARAASAASWLRKRGQTLEQVQIFMPLAGTAAAAMWFAGSDPKGRELYIADVAEQRRQKAMLTKPDVKNRSGRRPPSHRKKPGSRPQRSRTSSRSK